MINTAKAIGIWLLESSSIFEDFLVPIKSREKLIKTKSHIVPVYFYRYVGIDKDEKQYYKNIAELDERLLTLGDLYIKFTSTLPSEFESSILGKMEGIFKSYTQISLIHNNLDALVEDIYKEKVILCVNNNIMDFSIKKSIVWMLKLYIANESKVTSTAVKNFLLKITSWINKFVPNLIRNFNFTKVSKLEIHNPKVIYYGHIKKHEIYFLTFLSKIGCDVLYINSTEDNSFQLVDKEDNYSKLILLPLTSPLKEFPRKEQEILKSNRNVNHPPYSETDNDNRIDESSHVSSTSTLYRSEKSFEELASLSTSTVMIKKYDSDDKVIGTGSGVVINNEGLIVTNFHVIRNGIYFGIIFEDVQREFYTYTVINWDEDRDLVFLKIDLATSPIVINSTDNIKRGQKVVAIGSPLGLMNTISDGIVSGFRRSEDEDFIQITAPISPGSSGGALFNMYGELIGITSAGYLEGQNINLAVPTKYVNRLLEEKFTKFNLEVMDKCSCFNFDNMRFYFDGFFRHSQRNICRISLYRFEYNEYDFYTLTKNNVFSQAIEGFYLDNIIEVVKKYNIQNLEFEVGSENYIFAFSYNRGRVINKEWRTI